LVLFLVWSSLVQAPNSIHKSFHPSNYPQTINLSVSPTYKYGTVKQWHNFRKPMHFWTHRVFVVHLCSWPCPPEKFDSSTDCSPARAAPSILGSREWNDNGCSRVPNLWKVDTVSSSWMGSLLICGRPWDPLQHLFLQRQLKLLNTQWTFPKAFLKQNTGQWMSNLEDFAPSEDQDPWSFTN
jgi:hypothetical protein